MIYLLDLLGVFVFAVSGAMAAGRKHLDLFGVMVLALATALGGGTLRDLILGCRPFWVADPLYIYVAVGAAALTFLISGLPPASATILQTADAAGLAVFTVIGCQRALALEAAPVICVMMGVTTGVVGGMIRDLLAGEIPLILRREIYATASICGAAVYLVMARLPGLENLALYLTIGLILTLRLAAIHWRLSLPVFIPRDEDKAR